MDQNDDFAVLLDRQIRLGVKETAGRIDALIRAAKRDGRPISDRLTGQKKLIDSMLDGRQS